MTLKSAFYTLIWLLMAGAGSALIILAGVHLYLSPSLPSVDTLRDIRLQTPLRIYSYDGDLIGEIGEKRRTPIAYDNIPRVFIDALLSAEDDQFYEHNGVSIKGLMRASSQLLMSGDIQGGGSTITMQVARNYFLTRRQEFKRKFNEILLALRIERELSKAEILELYVNVIFLGNRAYGIEAAANIYYGKPMAELQTPQLAMLAGLPKAPSTMNPLANPERAKTRRDWILQRMFSLGKLSEQQYQEAIATPLSADYRGSNIELSAQYVAEMARKKAVEFFGLNAYTDGYNIYTTVLSENQRNAQRAITDGLLEYDQRKGYRGAEQSVPPPKPLAAGLVTPEPPQPPSEPEPAASKHPGQALSEPHTASQLSSLEQAQADTQRDQLTNLGKADPVKGAWLAELRSALEKTPEYANLEPAAVIGIAEDAIAVLTKGGSVAHIGWEQGLKQARRFVSINRREAPPKTAAEVVALGDIIRIRRHNNLWHFNQLPNVQGALVSLDAQNGAVLALVGGFDFNQSKFNRATQAFRQPGSNFKPFIYTSALENGLTPATIINDAPIVFEDQKLEADWRPENSGGKFLGPTRLRKALYRSQNMVSIRILQSVGIDNALANLDRFGIDPDKLPRDLSVALGSYDMSPMEVVAGYAVLANGGHRVLPFFIDRIENAKGEVIFSSERLTVCSQCGEPDTNEQELSATDEATATQAGQEPGPEPPSASDEEPADQQLSTPLGHEPEASVHAASTASEPELTPAPRVIDERVAYLMDSMLKDVVRRGTATKAKKLNRNDIAGKTGTTNRATDAWFSGYGGGIVTTTWVGFDQVSSLGNNEFGSTAALPIWINYMRTALTDTPETALPRPTGLVTTRINPVTGRRALPGDPKAIYEMFRAENVPELDTSKADAQSPWSTEQDINTEDIF